MNDFEKATPVTEDEIDDIRVELELEDETIQCKILTIFETQGQDYIALLPLNEYDENVFVYGYINHERNYFNNMKHITGHVPTPLTRSDEQPLILDYNNHLNIDCGIVYGGRLSCICLYTGKHYYIGEN